MWIHHNPRVPPGIISLIVDVFDIDKKSQICICLCIFKEQAVVTSVEESWNRSIEGSIRSTGNTGIRFSGKICCNYFSSQSR